MNNHNEKYSNLYNANNQDTKLFENELRNYIINLKDDFFNNFKDMYFLECSSSFYCNVFDLIKEKDNIYFENCHFFFNDITHKGNSIFKDSKVTFKNCIFESSWNISPDVNCPDIQLKYENCIFSDTLRIGYIHSYIQFNDCSFANIELENCNISNDLFINKKDIKYNINKIFINNCTFEEKFKLNNYSIQEFNCTNSHFENKFEFKNNDIIRFNIYNSNFEKIADMFASKFIQFKISKSIFSDFTGFENCIFGTSNNLIEELAEFEYVTFKDILTLRNTKFLSGLNLENINLLNDANFLKIIVEFKNTPRETFRLIKHSFDKISNSIEANKFFIKEMTKYKEELKKEPLIGNVQEKLVFNLNNIFSSFGQSYFKPLFYICCFTFVYQFILYGYEQNLLYEIYVPANQYIQIIPDFFNNIVKNILPFAKFLKKDLEFISLIFYIIFSILTWQTIVSIKRHTKR